MKLTAMIVGLHMLALQGTGFADGESTAASMEDWLHRMEHEHGWRPVHAFWDDALGVANAVLTTTAGQVFLGAENLEGEPVLLILEQRGHMRDAGVTLVEGTARSGIHEDRVLGSVDERRGVQLAVVNRGVAWNIVALRRLIPDAPQGLHVVFPQGEQPPSTPRPEPPALEAGGDPAHVPCGWGDHDPPYPFGPGEFDVGCALSSYISSLNDLDLCLNFPTGPPLTHAQCHAVIRVDARSGDDEFNCLSGCSVSPATSDVFFFAPGKDGGNCDDYFHEYNAFLPLAEGSYFRPCADVHERCRSVSEMMEDEVALNGKVKRYYMYWGIYDEVRPAQPTPLVIDYPAVISSIDTPLGYGSVRIE